MEKARERTIACQNGSRLIGGVILDSAIETPVLRANRGHCGWSEQENLSSFEM